MTRTTRMVGTVLVALTLVAGACGDSENGTTTEAVETETVPPGTEPPETFPDTTPPGVPATIPATGEVDAGADAPADLAAFESGSDLGLPPTELCEPGAPELIPLGELDPVDPGREDDLGGEALRVILENSRGQAFAVTAIAPTEVDARAGLDAVSVCLEALPVGDYPAATDEGLAPDLDDQIIAATVDALNADLDERGLPPITLADLIATRDGNSAGHSPTIAELVAAFGADPAVIEAAVLGSVTGPPAVSSADVEAAVEEVWNQPDVPFIDVEMLEARDAGDALLQGELAEEQGVVLYVFEVLDPSLDGYPDSPPDEAVPLALSFFIDPPVHRWPTEPYKRHYRAKCQTSAWARLHATAGRMTLYFWRKSPHYKWVGSRYANSNGPADPPSISHSSGSTRRSYDISVKGWQNNSDYWVGGGWTLGWRGGC